ncbi:DmsC/YnfH family molybdoenzyme membrane anchor subunit [Plesiomonas shigelloides]|uniref:DmsC/YnfH family molybdoenzyme membrane anchor subunit n=1 Tax=Plesiomonas shigelloides TaxID=703 RepID=UPI001261BFF0|nr:DmsC/YnfH family molybdoenzyme membrane anchor subunit [Plesiomonas shigelloides]KAB7668764.1 dimethylsulfoxide reductase [Plesiomonas shigelloides]
MIFQEYSLIFFTVLAQTVVGGYLLISTRALVLGYSADRISSYKVPMFFLWALMGIGFLFSMTHLGSPFRAFNAINKVGSAWLSNEILLGAAFFAVGGSQWLLSAINKGGIGLQKILMIVTMIFGVLFMYAMINVYMINTVPTWFNIYTPLSFVMTILVAGLALSHWIIVFANDTNFKVDRNILILAFAVIAASLIVTVGKATLVGNIHSSIADASNLVDGLNIYLGVQIALLMAGLLVWTLPMINKFNVNLVSLGFSLTLVLISELIGRGLFYSLHMTSGL